MADQPTSLNAPEVCKLSGRMGLVALLACGLPARFSEPENPAQKAVRSLLNDR